MPLLETFPLLRKKCEARPMNGDGIGGIENGIADAVNGALSYGEADPDVQAMVKHMALAYLYISRLRQKGEKAMTG